MRGNTRKQPWPSLAWTIWVPTLSFALSILQSECTAVERKAFARFVDLASNLVILIPGKPKIMHVEVGIGLNG